MAHILIDHMQNMLAEAQRLSFEREPSLAELRSARDFLEKNLSDPDRYQSYAVHRGQVQKLVTAMPSNDHGQKTTVVYPFFLGSSTIDLEDVKKELNALRDWIGSDKRKLMVRVFANQQREAMIFKELGFKLEAQELVGKTETTIELLEKLTTKPLGTLSLEPMNYERDIDEVLELLKVSHDNDPSSIRISQIEGLKGYFKAWCETKTSIVAKNDMRIIGLVGIGVKQLRPDFALVGSIAVHPDYQGRGLSRHLYLAGLREALKHGATEYYGYSTTTKVLASIETMGRKVRSFTYSIEV